VRAGESGQSWGGGSALGGCSLTGTKVADDRRHLVLQHGPLAFLVEQVEGFADDELHPRPLLRVDLYERSARQGRVTVRHPTLLTQSPVENGLERRPVIHQDI
jgi:hypothetical protein